MPKTSFIVNVDYNNNQLLNAVLQNLATHPSTANLTPGWLYFNTTDKTTYQYTGNPVPNEWLDLGAVSVVNNGMLTMATTGIATGSATFSANQAGSANFTVNVPGTNLGSSVSSGVVTITSSTGTSTSFNLPDIPEGTVTSVSSTSNATGLTLVTTNGSSTPTITLALSSGYSIPTISNQTSWTNKQDKLVAGSNITIDNVTNEISATDTKYTGSASIVLSGGSFQRAALTGDVTASANSNSTTISNSAVTNAKMANVPTNTIKGRVATGTGVVTDLTPAQVRTMLNVESGANNYVLPIASDSVLGGIMVGSGLAINGSGILSATNTATGTVTSVGLTVGTSGSNVSVTGSPVTSSGNITLNIPSASASARGVLTSADWTTFNNKQNALSGTGFIRMTGSTITYISGTSAQSVMADGSLKELIDDSAVAGDTTWSSEKIADEIDSALSGALQYIGEYNPVTNTPNITSSTEGVEKGFTYVVSEEGTFLGESVGPGDMIIAKEDNPLSDLNNWQVVKKDIPVILDASLTNKGIIQLASAAQVQAGTSDTLAVTPATLVTLLSTTSRAGLIALATQGEVNAGSVNNKAVTPATLKAYFDNSVGGYVAIIGDGTATTFNITHNMGTLAYSVYTEYTSNNEQVFTQVRKPNNNTVNIQVNNPLPTDSIRVILTR